MLGIRSLLLPWLLFFVICLGLGYPTLQRYDPRHVEGMSDTWKYQAITVGADTSAFREMFRCRVLVPMVARPFYWFALKFLPNWNAGFFGLLIANTLFCATTASLVVLIGYQLFDNLPTALLAAALYLLSFNIPNLQLAGLIDSGEACFMAAVVWSLLKRKWYLLPLWAILGGLAKETFVPFAVLLSFTWWLVERREQKVGGLELLSVVVLAVVGLTTVSTIHSAVAGQFRWPWQVGESRAAGSFFVALWRCFTERNFWFVFGWLIPLGVWRLKCFPKPWLAASVTSSILAFCLGAYIDAGGTVGRPVFNITGPLLSLSVALLISKFRMAKGNLVAD